MGLDNFFRFFAFCVFFAIVCTAHVVCGMADKTRSSSETGSVGKSTSDGSSTKGSSEKLDSKGKAPVQKAGSSGAKKEDSDPNTKILSLLMDMRKKMEKSEDLLNNVSKRVDDLENTDYHDYYGQYGDDEYQECPVQELGDEPECSDLAGACGTKRHREMEPSDESTENRFSSLAKRFKGQEITSNELDSVLASSITDIFRKGMEEEQYNSMIKDEKLARPENCDGLTVVKCNQLVWDLLSPTAIR